MQIYAVIASDTVPLVRKEASIALNQMIKLIPKVSDAELFRIFSAFFKDQHDSVRMQGIDCCVKFA